MCFTKFCTLTIYFWLYFHLPSIRSNIAYLGTPIYLLDMPADSARPLYSGPHSNLRDYSDDNILPSMIDRTMATSVEIVYVLSPPPQIYTSKFTRMFISLSGIICIIIGDQLWSHVTPYREQPIHENDTLRIKGATVLLIYCWPSHFYTCLLSLLQ